MATYAEVKAKFEFLLNRSDCTPEQTIDFLKDATRRIQRELKGPMMDRVLVVTAEAPLSNLQIPTDYIQLQEILVDGRALDKASVRQVMGMPAASGCPSHYARVVDRFVIRPLVPTGSEVVMLYQGEFEDLATESSSNSLLTSAPDLLIYGALSFAGDAFEHDKRSEWEGRYQAILDTINLQAIEDEFMGGPMVIQSAYPEY